MHRSCISLLLASISVAALPTTSLAVIVGGGGSPSGDCTMVLEIPGANKPAPPKAPKGVDCVDGDASCDDDGLRNGECVFPLQLCANSTQLSGCTPSFAGSVVVDHAIDDGSDPRFDNDFLALQSRANGLGLPDSTQDKCTLASAITVRLRGPDANDVMKPNRKTLRVTSYGETSAGAVRDVDKVKFTCRPEGDALYLPTDLYEGTFDRVRTQVFAQSCALAGCHDSESHAGNLILLSGAAYSNLVGVTPDNFEAASDMLQRIAPGDPASSFLYLKITSDLQPGYGESMPKDAASLDPALIELIRLWILGDGTLGPAPETGWVAGTDQ